MIYILFESIGYETLCSELVSEFDSNLVDPASSHMLVLKINPCMCKYSIIQRNCEWLLKTVIIYLMDKDMDNRSNSRANTCVKA